MKYSHARSGNVALLASLILFGCGQGDDNTGPSSDDDGSLDAATGDAATGDGASVAHPDAATDARAQDATTDSGENETEPTPDAGAIDATREADAIDAVDAAGAIDATLDAAASDAGAVEASGELDADAESDATADGSSDAGRDAAPDAPVEASIDAGTVALQITGGPLTCANVSGDGTSVECTTGTVTNIGTRATGGLLFDLAPPFTEGDNTNFCAPETSLGPGQSCILRIFFGPVAIENGALVVLAAKGTYDRTLTVSGVNGGSASTSINGTVTCSGDGAFEFDEMSATCNSVSDCCTDDNPIPSCAATDSGSRVCN